MRLAGKGGYHDGSTTIGAQSERGSKMTAGTPVYHGPTAQHAPRKSLLECASRLAIGLAAAGALLLEGSGIAHAQSSGLKALRPLPPLPPGSPAYLQETWRSALSAPMPFGATAGVIPTTLPQEFTNADPIGAIGSYQLDGPTHTAGNAFFQPLGTNGRSCGSCHVPSQGMGVSVDGLWDRFSTSGPKDPVFAPVDGANCPSAVTRSLTSAAPLGNLVGDGNDDESDPRPYSLLLNRGVFRIFLPLPANAEFTVRVVSDAAGCNVNPKYNHTVDEQGHTTRIISVYRRPKVATDLRFMTTTLANTDPSIYAFDPYSGAPLPVDANGVVESGNIMWDGREPTLESQAVNATLTHAQALAAPTRAQVRQIVDFESEFFSAQTSLNGVGLLTALGAQGGPEFLSATPAALPTNAAIDPNYDPMTLFDAWSTNTGTSQADKLRQSIYRGEQIFLLRPFTISNVPGFNDVPPANNSFAGGCAFCHSQASAGTDLFPRSQQDIGTTGTSRAFGGSPPANDLPVFELTCTAGTSTPYVGSVVRTNDPGLALITGKCADIGKVTVSTLRGLASRAPYFHDGSAATLMDVVNFYDRRFAIGLSEQEEIDLVNFLNAL
jgi:cytochrome c peroxidase